MIRRFFGVLVLLLVAAGWARAESVDKLPKPTSYVSDFADVIDAGSRQSLEDLCKQAYEKAHATIEVVTVNTLDGLTIEDFTTRLEDKWKVGPKGTDKAVVMVFAIQDHKRRIEVGYGLEGILNDAKVGDIGRSMAPQLKQERYGPAILSGVQQISKVIAADAGVTLDTGAEPSQPVSKLAVPHQDDSSLFIFVFCLFLGMLLLFITLALVFRNRGTGTGTGTGLGIGGNDDSLGGGGGSFGGVSDSSSSSFSDSGGGDFGGGFGGDSGGGGASGDW